MAATVCNGLKSLYSIRAIEYTHALHIEFLLFIRIHDTRIPLSHSFFLEYLQLQS